VIRFRIDGILHEIEKLPLKVHGAVSSRIKVLARMDIAERRRPQDGRIKTWRADREVELRVSSLATAFGEKVVIRVFDPTVLMTDLRDLGMSREDRERFERWVTSPSGLVLVTGPTGSGKTTTLYSTLRYLSGPEVNITTVEDPIEMVDPRFCQVQVQRQVDVSFASALRAMLMHRFNTELAGLAGGQSVGPLITEPEFALIRLVNAAENLDQCALPCAIVTDQRHNFTGE
jgi:general secretion pathway protein E